MMRDPVLLAVLRRVEYKLADVETKIAIFHEKLQQLAEAGLVVHLSVEGGEESEPEVEMF